MVNPPALIADRTFRPDFATVFMIVFSVWVVVDTNRAIAADVPHGEKEPRLGNPRYSKPNADGSYD